MRSFPRLRQVFGGTERILEAPDGAISSPFSFLFPLHPSLLVLDSSSGYLTSPEKDYGIILSPPFSTAIFAPKISKVSSRVLKPPREYPIPLLKFPLLPPSGLPPPSLAAYSRRVQRIVTLLGVRSATPSIGLPCFSRCGELVEGTFNRCSGLNGIIAVPRFCPSPPDPPLPNLFYICVFVGSFEKLTEEPFRLFNTPKS